MDARSVTPTAQENVFRVSFVLRMEEKIAEQIVCFIRANPLGSLDVYYSHNTHYARPIPAGPWKEQLRVRLSVSDGMWNLIRAETGMALLDFLVSREAHVLPGGIGDDLDKIDW